MDIRNFILLKAFCRTYLWCWKSACLIYRLSSNNSFWLQGNFLIMLLFHKATRASPSELWSAKQGRASLSVCLSLMSGLNVSMSQLPTCNGAAERLGVRHSSPLIEIPVGSVEVLSAFRPLALSNGTRETRGLWRVPGTVITPSFQNSTSKGFRASLGYSEIWGGLVWFTWGWSAPEISCICFPLCSQLRA